MIVTDAKDGEDVGFLRRTGSSATILVILDWMKPEALSLVRRETARVRWRLDHCGLLR